MSTIQLGDGSGTGWLNVTPGSVSGRGGVFPRLSFQAVARTPREKMSVQVHLLQAELLCGNESLGHASITGLWPSFSDYPFSIDVPVSRRAIAFISDRFTGDALDLTLSLTGWLHVRYEADPEDRRFLTNPKSGEWGFVTVGRSLAHLQFRIARSDWLKNVLEPIGTLEYVLTDIALPKGAAGSTFSNPLARLQEAERQFHLGHDAGVFLHCKAMVEAIPGAPKAIFAGLGDDEHAAILDALLKDAVHYFNRGRHVAKTGDQQGQFPVDHRDARLALTLAKVLLFEVAEVLSRPHT